MRTKPEDPALLERQLALFFRVWAFVVFCDRAVRGTSDAGWSVAIVVCAALLMLRPGSVTRIALLSAVHLAWYLRGYAERADIHWHIAGMMHLTCLLAIGAAWLRVQRPPRLSDLHPAVAPVARWLFAIGLMSAGFAKLNNGFFNPEVSCAVALLEFQRTNFPFWLIPNVPITQWVAMVSTVLAELGAPLLLLFRPTRTAGYAVALGLCLVIGLNPVAYLFEFAGEFLAMSIFFASPARIAAGLDALAPVRGLLAQGLLAQGLLAQGLLAPLRRIARFSAGGSAYLLGRPVRGLAVGLLGLLGLGVLVFGWGSFDFRIVRLEVCRAVYVVGLGLYAVVLGIGTVMVRAREPRLQVLPTPWFVAVVPLIFLGGEVCTYIGLKHIPTMTMAANNATSTAWSNHLLVNPVPAFEFNRVVRIKQSSDKRLKAGQEMVWLRFSDWIARHPRATVDYVVAGVPGHAEGALEGSRADARFVRSIWPGLLRLDSQVFPRRSPDCSHRVGDKH